MQGLPFDDNDFAPPVSDPQQWMVPQRGAPQPQQPAHPSAVPDDELYSIVASNQSTMARFSHHLPTQTQPPINVYPQAPLPPDPAPKRPPLTQHAHASAAAPSVSHKNATPLHLSLLPNPPSMSVASPVSLALSTSVARASFSPTRKTARSAVEEARLRAQREAESFAESRRPKRDRAVSRASEASCWSDVPSVKRLRADDESGRHVEREQALMKAGDESEVEKQQRYRRRLDMNRESAAVSRVRRRAYVKELEERLAAVEAEKLQLEGKLEIMMSQNESFKKQLEHLFMMVAGQRRPAAFASAPSAAAAAAAAAVQAQAQVQAQGALPAHAGSHGGVGAAAAAVSAAPGRAASRTVHSRTRAHQHGASAAHHNASDGM